MQACILGDRDDGSAFLLMLSIAAAGFSVDADAPGQRASPCPHFLEGCGGCQFIHLDLTHQRTSKQQLLQQMLQQVLLRQQKLHNQQTPQQDIGRWEPPKVAPLVPAASETQFAARADMLLQLVEGIPRLGLPAYDGCSNIVGVQDCIRLKGPLRELYRHLTDVLLPLLKSRQLRILDQRCGAGTLSGLSLRLAEDCTGCNGMVLLRLKGHLESNVRPRLVQLAETLSKRCPALKAVTFHDLRRSNPTSLLASGIATAATFGAAVDTSSRIAALAAAPGAALGAGAATEPRGTRESVVGRGNALQQIWPAVEKAAGRAAGRLWGALGSAGLFEILLSALFKEVREQVVELSKNTFAGMLNIPQSLHSVVVFASSAPDAEETRKNMALNDLYWGEVVECPDSGGVTAAFAARSGFSGPRRAQHRSQQGNALGKSTKSPRRVERAFEVEASDDSVEAASGVTLAGPPHLPDVLLLSPSRGGLPKNMRRWVAAAAIPRVVYIAHDQPAFFRDAEALVAAG
ncbi:RNA methyltransferase, TrmA family, putative [Eimeria maxima]|uniref:RNA methyltransferase, TrmA family, putative n=1 Tax=Eimeria maxima TaxID=5804 RepID=U6M3T7_EIMMA|nr:RNA methyltransferase, TrmA family, putative [Eimeria maxima]CDJ58897.1 RNA methyltransferase, TrmA family, putative [Eimeria maxima]